MKLSKINPLEIYAWVILVIGITVFLTACKTREASTQKQEQKSEVKKEEVKTKTIDSTSVKKAEQKTKTEEKKDITNTNTTVEEITTFSKEKDASGKQLIASVTKRNSNQVILDKSVLAKEEFQLYIDSLRRELKQQSSLKLDSIGESQNRNKEVKSDSTLQANVPWWVWIVAVAGFYVVYLMIKQ